MFGRPWRDASNDNGNNGYRYMSFIWLLPGGTRETAKPPRSGAQASRLTVAIH